MALLVAGAFAAPAWAAAAKSAPTHKLHPASATEQKLPGVGPTTAKAVIQFGTKSGFFHRVEDLPAIRGICEKKLSIMRRSITVGGPAAESFIRIHQRLI